MSLTIESRATLNDGHKMPVLGLGVWQAASGKETRTAVATALQVGYRLIDTAKMYANERDVGAAVRQSGIPRDEIFVTTKLWNSDHGYESALRAFERSRREVALDYIDLYLIHWPVPGLRDESWKAFAKLHEEGLARSIGVSNYTIRHLEEMLPSGPVAPSVNQVEFHPFLYQKELLEFCREQQIQLEAYSPLARRLGPGIPRASTSVLPAKHGLPVCRRMDVIFSWRPCVCPHPRTPFRNLSAPVPSAQERPARDRRRFRGSWVETLSREISPGGRVL